MFNSIINFLSMGHNYLEVPLASLLLAINIGATEAKPLLSQTFQAPATSQVAIRTAGFGTNKANTPKGKLPEVDGTYVYGQSPQPQQIGQEYMVFEMHQGQVIGAFYLPQSEFNCFRGTMDSGKLALMMANNLDSDANTDLIADQNAPKVATASESPSIGDGYGAIKSPYSVALQNYYQLSAVSKNDQQILTSCKNNYQQSGN